MKNSETAKVYQIKVTLNSIRPPIWRRILVSDKITLLDLHDVIQKVFGWEDYHLHQFEIHGVLYGDPADDEYDEFDIHDEMKFKLHKLGLTEGSRFTYEYDFGDSWDHTLVVEKILPFEKGKKIPQCIKGKRACPPEDVGGPWGYEGFLEAIDDPQNEEHDSYLEWIGGEFDPEAFDLETINERLHQKPERTWSGSTPSPIDGEPRTKDSIFDPARWEKLFTKEGDETANALELRKDVITFLTYLKDNKVIGTQSTGNLPRKVIEEIVPRFVNPPILETKLDDQIFRFQNEDDIWSLCYVHLLAQGAELISGGPGRRWRLTHAGDEFLTTSPLIQVFVLFVAWWYRINWLIASSIDIFGNELPIRFSNEVASHLLSLPINEPQLIESYADQLLEVMGWKRIKQDNDHSQMAFIASIQQLVIGPLESFGILTTKRMENLGLYIERPRYESFMITKFGYAMLESISIVE